MSQEASQTGKLHTKPLLESTYRMSSSWCDYQGMNTSIFLKSSSMFLQISFNPMCTPLLNKLDRMRHFFLVLVFQQHLEMFLDILEKIVFIVSILKIKKTFLQRLQNSGIQNCPHCGKKIGDLRIICRTLIGFPFHSIANY